MKYLSLLLLAVLSILTLSCNGSSDIDDSEPVLETPRYLFVQEAQSGSFLQTSTGTYQLVLSGVSEQTIYFAERPFTDAGQMSTSEYIGSFNWEPEHPTAAVVVKDGNEEEDTLIVKLSAPNYNAAAHTLSYAVEVIDDYHEGNLDSFISDSDTSPPASFGRATVFIDDSQVAYCDGTYAYGTNVAIPAGLESIERVNVGELILASQDSQSWEVASVKFSSGTGSAPTNMVSLRFSDQTALMLAPDSCLVMADGKVKRASQLLQGETVKGSIGTDKSISSIAIGQFKTGVHGISTLTGTGSSFISVNGVTATEYLWRGIVQKTKNRKQ